MSKLTPERKNMSRIFADKCGNSQTVSEVFEQTKSSPGIVTAFTSTQQPRTVSDKVPAISVGYSKLVRKHLQTGERHRLLKQAASARVSLVSSYDANGALPPQNLEISRLTPPKPGPYTGRHCLFETDYVSDDDSSPTHPLARNVTEEDEECSEESLGAEHRQDSPSAPQTPSSLDDDVRNPMQFVRAREECVNPVSRILWSKTDEEEEVAALMEDPCSFCVVSPAVIRPKPSSVIAKPMAIRPMLLA